MGKCKTAPDWCNMPRFENKNIKKEDNIVDCWSWLNGSINSRKGCVGCECYIPLSKTKPAEKDSNKNHPQAVSKASTPLF
jgi:hypothetical protein